MQKTSLSLFFGFIVAYTHEKINILVRAAACALLLCGLFYEAIFCISFHVSFCSCIFSSFSIAITLLGEERANLSAFRTFVRFVLVWICRFPLPLRVWEGLRFVIVHSLDFSLTFFVIVALPGLFSYLFCFEQFFNLLFL